MITQARKQKYVSNSEKLLQENVEFRTLVDEALRYFYLNTDMVGHEQNYMASNIMAGAAEMYELKGISGVKMLVNNIRIKTKLGCKKRGIKFNS